MKIHLAEWLELHQLQTAAITALAAYDFALMNIAMRHEEAEAQLLMGAARDADTARMHLACFDCHPQSEWMGGPTSGPGSEKTRTYLREPHGRRYFTKEEVEAAKALGLLQGGPDLTGPEK